MPIKQVFESAKAVYPPTNRPIPRVYDPGMGFGFDYFSANAVDTLRIYHEYHWYFRGLFTVRDPSYPGDFEIHLHLVCKMEDWPSWTVKTYKWDGRTGAFLGSAQNGLSFLIHKMFAGPDGSIWATSLYDQELLMVDPVTWVVSSHHVSTFGANIGANGKGMNVKAVDPARDVALLRLNTDDAYSLSVCRLSTGDWLRTIDLAGATEAAFIAEPPCAYAVNANGSLTAFNYETGAVLGVLHTGLLSGGFSWDTIAFTWDPFMRRVLYGLNPGDTLPDGDCNTQIKGFYPVAEPIGMTPPIPLKYPQKGKTVPVWSRVYGGASEGIAGQELTYTVGTGSTATIAPARKATESNGTVTVQLTSTDSGANSITSETTVP